MQFHSIPSELKTRILDFKDYAPDIPQSGIFDDPVRCYKINERWATIVMGMVSWLLEPTLWKDATDERYVAIQEISKFLQGMECMSFELRQNPTNPCLIEQSLDGGDTWNLAFDLSNCVSIVDGASQTSQDIYNQTTINNFNNTYNNFQETIYNHYENNYINSVTDVAPELGYDATGDDVFRDEGLCWAIQQMVDQAADVSIQYYDDISAASDDVKNVLYLGAAVIAIIGLAASGIGTPAAAALAANAALWGAGIGLTSAIGNELLDIYTTYSKSNYENEGARATVVCCIYNNLKGANVDRDDFISAFTCGGGSTTTAVDAIMQATEAMFANDAGYASFTEKSRIGFQSSKSGLLQPCPCDTWCYEFSVAMGNLSDWTAHDEGDGNGVRAVLDGSGWTSTNVEDIKHLVQIEISFAETLINDVSVTVDEAPDVFNQLRAPDRNGADFQQQVGGTNPLYNLGVSTTGLWVSHDDNSGTQNTAHISKIVVTGQGVNPFGVDNC